MRKRDLPTIREIVDKNRKEREKERKKGTVFFARN
jgi:hypothetical protein